MRPGIIVAGVIAAILIGALIGSEAVRGDTQRALDECARNHAALEDELQRQWRRHFTEPPRESEMVTVYPAGWTCARLPDGRWECRVP